MPDFGAVGRAVVWVVITAAAVLTYDPPVVEEVPPVAVPTPEPEPTQEPFGPPVPVERATGTEEAREGNYVVRGGVASANNLMNPNTTREHLAVDGLFGFSVQYRPGLSIQQFAAAGQFPHAQISVTTDAVLLGAAAAAGFPTVRIVSSPGRGYHHTVEVPTPLPLVLAEALSTAFFQMPNPALTSSRT